APSGPVEIRAGSTVVATGELAVDGLTGTATVTLPRDLAAGAHRLTAAFPGTVDVAGSTSGSATYLVLPALSRVDIDVETRAARPVLPAPSGGNVRVGRGARGSAAAETTVAVLGGGGAPVPTGPVTVSPGRRLVARVPLDEAATAEVQPPPVRLLTVVTAT